jgi:hypothetical protein
MFATTIADATAIPSWRFGGVTRYRTCRSRNASASRQQRRAAGSHTSA